MNMICTLINTFCALIVRGRNIVVSRLVSPLIISRRMKSLNYSVHWLNQRTAKRTMPYLGLYDSHRNASCCRINAPAMAVSSSHADIARLIWALWSLLMRGNPQVNCPINRQTRIKRNKHWYFALLSYNLIYSCQDQFVPISATFSHSDTICDIKYKVRSFG